jgi:hypothetical protein
MVLSTDLAPRHINRDQGDQKFHNQQWAQDAIRHFPGTDLAGIS